MKCTKIRIKRSGNVSTSLKKATFQIKIFRSLNLVKQRLVTKKSSRNQKVFKNLGILAVILIVKKVFQEELGSIVI